MALRLGVVAALSENLSSIPGPHMASSVKGLMPSFGFLPWVPAVHGVHTHRYRQHTYTCKMKVFVSKRTHRLRTSDLEPHVVK